MGGDGEDMKAKNEDGVKNERRNIYLINQNIENLQKKYL